MPKSVHVAVGVITSTNEYHQTQYFLTKENNVKANQHQRKHSNIFQLNLGKNKHNLLHSPNTKPLK